MSMQRAGRPGGSLLGNLLSRAKYAIAQWRVLRKIDTREIEVVARELNLSPAELVSLMFTPPDTLESLDKRLTYAGLSPEELLTSNPAELRDLRRICSQCRSKVRCARDLRHKRMATPSQYCPNEPTLRALALEAHRARSAQIVALPANLS